MRHEKSDLIASIQDYVAKSTPELEAPLLTAVEVLDSAGALPVETLQSVVEAASSRLATVYETGVTVLGELAEADIRALDAIQQMFASSKAHVRHNALLCLTEWLPSKVSTELLRHGLGDKSARVRAKAADWAGRLRLQTLASDLARAVLVESNAEARDVIAYELQMLRAGYVVKSADGGKTYLVVDTPRGRIGVHVSNEAISRKGLKEVASDVARGV